MSISCLARHALATSGAHRRAVARHAHLYYCVGKFGARALQNFGLEAGCSGGFVSRAAANIFRQRATICHCAKTARLLREKLKLPKQDPN